ncbi:MAG: rod shape-determining protein RodA [Coriobacteriales bacterium]|jgi:rod shape determining protein RodA|nr:rod shape-determining protein RodA [Coriobacteriales bacterium]
MSVTPKIQAPSASQTPYSGRKLLRRFLNVVNIPLVLMAAAVTAFGLIVVWSATLGSTEYSFTRQLQGVAVGAVALGVFWRLDYHRFELLFLPLLILDVVVILLPLLPFIGVTSHGAQSWVMIFGVQAQPGELAKIITILFMASLVSRYRGRLDSGREYIKVSFVLLVPLASIMLQPDLGTGLVFFAIGVAILFTGGAHYKWLIASVVLLVFAVVGILTLDPILDQWAGHDVFIKDYQKNRLLVFMDETIDPSGIGYNLKQAKIAIGSGGLMGKGLTLGTQSGLGFLPEAPTDFIFCVLAEELGFLGSVSLIVVYGLLIFAALRIALKASDLFGSLIVTGVIGMWIFQILENIGMTCGLMPITGIPLPFVSYGSSFMLVNFIALGLLLSVWTHRTAKKEQ